MRNKLIIKLDDEKHEKTFFEVETSFGKFKIEEGLEGLEIQKFENCGKDVLNTTMWVKPSCSNVIIIK